MEIDQVKKGFAEVNGGRLYYEMAGEGEAILFIHGLFQDSRLWDEQFRTFSKSHRVIRFDARGFGNTEINDDPFANYDDIKALLDYLKVDRVDVVGLSMGAHLAAELAVVYPELVKSLVLCSFKLANTEESAELQQCKKEIWQAFFAKDIDRCVELNVDKWLKGSGSLDRISNENIALYRTMLELNLNKPMIERKPIFVQNINERLGEIQAKTLILYGEYDYPDYSTGAELLEQAIQYSQKIAFQHSAHMLNLSEPDYFNSVLQEFLKA